MRIYNAFIQVQRPVSSLIDDKFYWTMTVEWVVTIYVPCKHLSVINQYRHFVAIKKVNLSFLVAFEYAIS